MKAYSFLLALVLIAPLAWAQNSEKPSGFWKKRGANLGLSYEYGQLGDSGMELKDRAMTALSVEGLLGYRISSQKLILGVDFNYRIQNQQAALVNTDGTNLKGKGWLVGLGANYRLSQSWALQAAIDLFGEYTFDKQTLTSEDDHLAEPLSLRFKTQYFCGDHWSIDASFNYLRWRNFHVGGQDHDEPAHQGMAGLGLTYHFHDFKSEKMGD